MVVSKLAIVALLVAAAGCNDQSSEQAESAGLLETQLEAPIQALEKSRNLEQQVLDAARQQREDIERASAGSR
ncbi:MAG: hypothetical protein RQ741_08680 [Wenzhouxiangellaceae bacterium]|nr:hypothetical protein [Wenzhouxiangellaceae bacterium]